MLDLTAPVRNFLERRHRLLIGGDWVEADSGKTIEVINPATGARLCDVSAGEGSDVNKAVVAARQAFETGPWSRMTGGERARILLRVADLMDANVEELAQLETLDNGKPVRDTRARDVPSAAEFLRHYAGWCTKLYGRSISLSLPAEFHAYTRHEPIGVAGQIIPWNFPLQMAVWKLAPALAVGCTCVLKPAEQTPLTALRLGELLLEAGLPAGVVNIVTGYGATAGAAIAAHPGIDKVAFTGSTAVGRQVLAAAAGNLKKVSLELGGKSPTIIFPDADLLSAIRGAATAIYANAGQVCVAGSRLYAAREIFDEVVAGVAEIARTMRVGDGMKQDTEMGPLVSKLQQDRVTAMIASGIAEGASVVAGGGHAEEGGFFVEPTVLTDVSPSMRVVREEIFGPVLVASPFDDIDALAATANDTEYGLAANIWTRAFAAPTSSPRGFARAPCGSIASVCHRRRCRSADTSSRAGDVKTAPKRSHSTAKSNQSSSHSESGRDGEKVLKSGADTLVQTFLAGGLDVCFANPGTSEMHFVSALDTTPGMRCVLGLFEGVVTGAADGYYRVAGKPAATLLHLAPGLGNGFANLHNARKARSGIVNVVGEHATYYRHLDTPLSGDIEGVARSISNWVRTSLAPEYLPHDAAEAVRVASEPPGNIATLILPADVSWGAGAAPIAAIAPRSRSKVAEVKVAAAAQALRAAGAGGGILLGGASVRGQALEHAGRISAATGCRLFAEIHNARLERGAGRVPVTRIPYTQPVEKAIGVLAGSQALVLAGAREPLSFFAYPGKPYRLAPPDCALWTLAEPGDDIEAALEALADALDARSCSPLALTQLRVDPLPTGPVTPEGLGQVIAALLPDNAIVVDEAVTAGRSFFGQLATARPHDWMSSMGASIGFALPCALGAAVAAPERKVIALSGDGSAMYTLQALWTMARESLDVTVIVFANRRYRILEGEFANLGLGTPGSRAEAMLSIGDPALDWCSLARGHGVESGRVETLDEFAIQLRRALDAEGPYLIEVCVP